MPTYDPKMTPLWAGGIPGKLTSVSIDNHTIDAEVFPRITTSDHKPRTPNPMETNSGRMEMLAMRLRIPINGAWGFDHISTALGKDKVFVFIVQNDRAVALEDDASLFPSDTLVTQLRLLQK